MLQIRDFNALDWHWAFEPGRGFWNSMNAGFRGLSLMATGIQISMASSFATLAGMAGPWATPLIAEAWQPWEGIITIGASQPPARMIMHPR